MNNPECKREKIKEEGKIIEPIPVKWWGPPNGSINRVRNVNQNPTLEKPN